MRFGKLLLLLFAANLCHAQVDRIAGPIDVSQKVALPGNVHPLARAEYDQGLVDGSLPFGSVTLEIAPSPAQQAALDQLLANQQNRNSPSYHKWLTPEQYADRFGLSQNDMDKITTWLQLQGFTVVRVARGRNAVVFSGSAAQIQSVFDTELHRYNVNGESHIANSTTIEVPAALSGVVTSIRGLDNFRPKPMYVRAARGARGPHPHYTTTISGQTDYFIAPGDIATLYDINPLYQATTPIDGTGQQLAIIGQTDVYLADINDFRSGFGLSTIPSTCTTTSSGVIVAPCTTTNFSYILVGTDEGVSPLGDIVEADLDLEWSGAVARNAQIVFVNAPVNSTETVGGVNVALQYAIDNNVAPVMSMSYGICEAFLTQDAAESLETELQQANAQGITVMNSAGDTGAFACDNGPPGGTSTSAPSLPYGGAVNGIAVNYPASSTEVTGVGGTSIPTQYYTATYWGPTNATDGGSAQPALVGSEAAWNDDPAFALFCQGNPTSSFCENGGSSVPGWVALGTNATAQQVQQDIWINAGGGGLSNCYGETSTGICTGGFALPSWQTGISIPGLSSSARLVPDVSLLASPNYPGYIICTPMNALTGTGSDTSSSCASGIETAVNINFSLIGGTSASTPVFAGIVTLINQDLGTAGLGNINPTLYTLAKTASNNYFHPVTSGENDVYCQAGTPTGQPTTPAPGVICPAAGVAGFSASAFDTKTHYNLVTGLGSVDVNNLATAWNSSRTGGTSITITSPTTALNIYQGASVTFTASVTPSSSIGAVSFSALNSTTSTTSVVGSASVNTPYPQTTTGTATFTTTALQPGTNTVTAMYEGDATNTGAASSNTATVTVTVPYTLSPSPSTLSVPAGTAATSVITVTPTSGFTGAVNFSCSSGLPVGATCSFSNAGSVSLNGTTAATITLTITTLPNMAQVSAIPITVNAASSAPAALITTPITLSVTPTTETVTLATTANTFSVGVGGTSSVQLTVGGTNGFITGSNTTVVPLTFTCSGIPASAEISCQPQNNGQPTNATTVTVNLVTTSATSQLRSPFERHRILYAALLPGIFGIAFFRPRMRGVRWVTMFILIGLCTLWLAACGGKSNNPGPGQLSNGGTPPGNYTITINATTGGAVPLNASKAITLSVSTNQ